MLWALFWVTSTSVTPKKDESTCGTRHSPTATRERLLYSILFFRMSLRLPNLTTQEKTLQPLETYALFQGLIGYSSIYLWLKYVISAAPLMLMRISGKFSSDHAAVRLVILKPTHRRDQSKRIPSWMSKHPIYCCLLQQLHDDHRFSKTRFVHLQNLRFS